MRVQRQVHELLRRLAVQHLHRLEVDEPEFLEGADAQPAVVVWLVCGQPCVFRKAEVLQSIFLQPARGRAADYHMGVLAHIAGPEPSLRVEVDVAETQALKFRIFCFLSAIHGYGVVGVIVVPAAVLHRMTDAHDHEAALYRGYALALRKFERRELIAQLHRLLLRPAARGQQEQYGKAECRKLLPPHIRAPPFILEFSYFLDPPPRI